MKENTEALLQASKEVDLEANTHRTEYMVVSRHQNVVQNYNILIANKSFENVVVFKYLRTSVTNENLIREEIKSRFN
jgi:hypothetical protein